MSNSRPLVSVLCVTMNHAKYVEQSFNSVVNQTYRNIEIFYIDNSSSDDSFEIADEIFKKSGLPYQGFKQKETKLLSANLNFLNALSKGKYLTVQSGDDWWELNNLEEKINYFEANTEFGMIYGGGYKYFYDTNKKELISQKLFKTGWVLKDLLKYNFIIAIGFVVKKDVLEKVGNFDENSLFEDWDLWIRIAEKYPIGLLDKPLIYYGRQTGSNISSNIQYTIKGMRYICDKYAKYKEIAIVKKRADLMEASMLASENPSFKSLETIFKRLQFNIPYFKQVAKCLLGMMNIRNV